jgi:hypothetical protein
MTMLLHIGWFEQFDNPKNSNQKAQTKEEQTMLWPREKEGWKRRAMDYEAQHRILKSEQNEPNFKTEGEYKCSGSVRKAS